MKIRTASSSFFVQGVLFVLIVSCLSSCYSRRNLVYLQDSGFSDEYPTLVKNRRPIYKLQVNDVLDINIQNPDSETAQYFNYGEQEMRGIGNPSNLFLMGNAIDEDGLVTVPLIGKVKVVDLSIDEAKKLLQQEVDKFLRNTTVDVKLISFKISVMGEVNNPGYYYVYNGQANILEGLSLAGDLTQFGNRKNIKLIRQTDDGAEVILLNLSSSEIMKSKYYYLLPNDVIYVEPEETQIKRANLQPITVVFSALSTAALIITAVLRFDNNQ